MAKENRFPSDATKSKKPAKKEAPEAEKIVEGKSQETVIIHYKKENNHFLTGVHSLALGMNTVDKATWNRCKNHPTVLQLIKDGHLIDLSADQEECDAEVVGTSIGGPDGDEKQETKDE